MNKRSVIDLLIAEGTLQSGTWLDIVPPSVTPEVPPTLADRIRGMLLGVAIGDALGNTTESVNPSIRSGDHGEIRDYLPNWHAGGRSVGLPSDDTQLTFRTLEQLLHSTDLAPDELMERFAKDQIYGIGQATKDAILTFKEYGYDWEHLGSRSAGNGALMRIAPVLLPYLATASADLWVDTVLATAVTHRDTAAIASSVAWVAMLWDLLRMPACPDSDWWGTRFAEVVRGVESPTSSYRPRGGEWSGFEGRFSDWLGKCAERFPSELSIVEGGRLWYSGAYLLETVPSVLHILTHYTSDPEEAMIRAVNDTRDNDTVAAIVGSAIGALHGAGAFPARWREGLLGRLNADDDGQVAVLIEAAVRQFVPSQTTLFGA